MNSELFILGDPRFLSGGAPRCRHSSYDTLPPVVNPGEEVTSKTVIDMAAGRGMPLTDGDRIGEILSICGQNIRFGRESYHNHNWHPENSSVVPNIFVTEGAEPTAGVEIETYVRSDTDTTTASQALRSNWFHFEEDGSLDRTVGFELITDVLTPRYYRDLRLWTGLQNLTGPYLDSYTHPQTGLHVHVGVGQFDKCTDLPVNTESDRRALAKYAIAFVYNDLLDKDYLDKVFLRKNGGYCRETGVSAATGLKGGKEIPTTEMFDAILSVRTASMYDRYVVRNSNDSGGIDLRSIITYDCGKSQIIGGSSVSSSRETDMNFGSEFSGHSVELNFSHPYTVEFRRGKGTLNAVSVHRMVELCTLIVRYVWSLARNPMDTVVSAENAYRFIINNTNSEALKKITEKQLARLGKNGQKGT